LAEHPGMAEAPHRRRLASYAGSPRAGFSYGAHHHGCVSSTSREHCVLQEGNDTPTSSQSSPAAEQACAHGSSTRLRLPPSPAPQLLQRQYQPDTWVNCLGSRQKRRVQAAPGSHSHSSQACPLISARCEAARKQCFFGTPHARRRCGGVAARGCARCRHLWFTECASFAATSARGHDLR
jgi:hypothetical protein